MYRAIVVGTDGSDTAGKAVEEAVRLAEAFDAPLHVVSAYRTTAATSAASAEFGMGAVLLGDWLLDARSKVESRLESVARQLGGRGVKTTVHALAGNPVDAILKVAADTDADLVVVGSKGMNGARRVLGSVPNSVAHKASCTVLVVKTC